MRHGAWTCSNCLRARRAKKATGIALDFYALKIRVQRAAAELRSLRWDDPDQRRILVLLVGGAALLVLVPIAGWALLGSAVTTSRSEEAARLNDDQSRAVDPAREALARVRDELSVQLREDDRFAGVLLRPGASAEAPDAVATLQGTVSTQSAFDALVGLVESLSLGGAVHVRVAVDPGSASDGSGG